MSSWQTYTPPAPAVSPEELARQKDKFADAYLRTPENSFAAACTVFGTDTATALKVSSEWPFDLYVLQRQAELLETFGPDEFLPTKQQVARRIFETGERTNDVKDKLAAYRLYAELRGFMPRGDGANVSLTVNNNRVMVMRDFGNDDDWEKSAVTQQSKLIEHSRD